MIEADLHYERFVFSSMRGVKPANDDQSRLNEFEREALCHLSALRGMADHILRNRDDSDDIVQETYLRAWKYFDSFDSDTNCRAWLFRIMFNVINRRKSQQTKLSELPLESDEYENYQLGNVVAFDPLKRLEGIEVLDAANRLPQDQRAVLRLVVVEEYTYREAAEILDAPVGTVMSRLHRARHALRKLLLTAGRVA